MNNVTVTWFRVFSNALKKHLHTGDLSLTTVLEIIMSCLLIYCRKKDFLMVFSVGRLRQSRWKLKVWREFASLSMLEELIDTKINSELCFNLSMKSWNRKMPLLHFLSSSFSVSEFYSWDSQLSAWTNSSSQSGQVLSPCLSRFSRKGRDLSLVLYS